MTTGCSKTLSKTQSLSQYHAQTGNPAEKRFSPYDLREQAAQYRKQKKYTQAIALLQRVIRFTQQEGMLDALFWARNELAETYKESGDRSQAVTIHLQNLRLIEQNPAMLAHQEHVTIISLSKIYTLQKKYQQSIDLLQQTLKKPNFGRLIQGDLLEELGINHYLIGKLDLAESNLRQAITAYEQARATGQDTSEAVGREYEGEIEVNRWLQQVLIAQNRPYEALELAEQNRAREFLALLSARNSSPKVIPPNIETIRRIAKTQNATLVQYSIAYGYNPAFQLTYRKDEARHAERLFSWVIEPSGVIHFHEQNLSSLDISLAQQVYQTRNAIGARGSITVKFSAKAIATPVEASIPKSDAALSRLHQVLIDPIAKHLPQNPDHRVIFIPQDFLFLVPFPALQDAQGQALIEHHTISQSPSIRVLELANQKQSRTKPGQGVLVVGNPTMPKIRTQPGQTPQSLASLPGAEAEAKKIAKLFQTEALIRNQASKAKVVQQLADAQIIHLATHGILDNSFGQLSSLALSPSPGDTGFLTAREIINMKLKGELVVLSACNTGRGTINGDGVLGLSRSFLGAGMPSVVVSLWAVPDASTATLMAEFYQSLKSGSDKAQALRHAMLTTRKQYPNPLDWAAFTLVGEAETTPSLKVAAGKPVARDVVPESFYAELPVPDGVTHYTELPSAALPGNVDIVFQTQLSTNEVGDFYRQTFQQQGLYESRARITIDKLSMVFINTAERRRILVQSDRRNPSEPHQVYVRVESMRPSP